MMFAALGSVWGSAAVAEQQSAKEIIAASGEGIDINNGWRFHHGDVTGAEAVSYSDASWDSVDLPHDYSISLPYNRNGEAESGYKRPSVGWYRKTLKLKEEFQGYRVILHFDGSYMDTHVWVNGVKCGVNPYGYNMFSFDITDLVKFGESNTIAVKCNYQNFNSRWYSGAGIYRDVKIFLTPKTHFEEDSLLFTTPDLSDRRVTQKTAQVSFAVKNDDTAARQVGIKTELYLRDAQKGEKGSLIVSKQETKQISAGSAVSVQHDLKVTNPLLWSPEEPNLYVVHIELSINGELAQTLEKEVGFRYYTFDRNKGFSLNGKRMKLLGVCLHHDQGALGAAAYADAIERQLTILKKMGVNAIRVTHNPSARVFKDLANRLGFMVVEEIFDTWIYAKNGNNYDFSKWFQGKVGSENKYMLHAAVGSTWAEFTLKQTVRAGVNDPSIIMWSMGNELMQQTSGSNFGQYPAIMRQLIGYIRELDQTRPVTFGDNYLKQNNSDSNAMAQVIHEAGGVVGFNYAVSGIIDRIHNWHLRWALYASEVGSAFNSRGVYNTGKYDRQEPAYDASKANWGQFAAQVIYDVYMRDYLAGLFVWTGFDYIGEPTPYNETGAGAVGTWPSPKNSYFGIVDTAGLPKDSYYLFMSQWNKDVTTLHILPAWKRDFVSRNSDGTVRVDVYSNAPKVEVFVDKANGTTESYGAKTIQEITTALGHVYYYCEENAPTNQNFKNMYRSWQIPFTEGTLRAVAYDKYGKVIENTVGVSSRKSYGTASALTAELFKTSAAADDHTLNYVTVNVVDGNGELVQNAGHRVTISVSGPAKLVGIDNGNSLDHDSYQASNRRAFNGQLVAIVKMTGEEGKVTVTASADGLSSASISFDVASDGKTRLKQDLIAEEGGDDPSGENIARRARISQSIPAEHQSDNLMAIVDGVRIASTVSSGTNYTIWSNYNAVEAGITNASITFEFDEVREIYEVVLYQYTDAWSADLPGRVTFKPQGGTNGTYTGKLVEETRLSDTTVRRVYRFNSPLMAKTLTITERPRTGKNFRSKRAFCVGLAEVEIFAR